MNLRLADIPAKPALALAMLITASITAPAAEQGFLDRARGLLGNDTEPVTLDAVPPANIGPTRDTNLTDDEIGAGLKEALQVAVGAVVTQLGSPDGFNADPIVHIPLPQPLGRIQSITERAGMGTQFDNLELRLNRAAETAVGRTGDLLISAINDMTLDDVMSIYRGPDDAATQYFRGKMSESLATDMRPIVDASLQDAGAAKVLESVIDQYHALPLSREVDTDLTSYVVDRGLEGIFHYLAQEEAAIRQNPLKRSSELLQRVFDN